MTLLRRVGILGVTFFYPVGGSLAAPTPPWSEGKGAICGPFTTAVCRRIRRGWAYDPSS